MSGHSEPRDFTVGAAEGWQVHPEGDRWGWYAWSRRSTARGSGDSEEQAKEQAVAALTHLREWDRL